MLIQFPIIIAKENEAPLYFFNQDSFGLISKGAEKFYQKGLIYDSAGSKFLINGIKSVSKASWVNSLKYFQSMYKVEVKCALIGQLNLDDFKKEIEEHIKKHSKYWESKDSFTDLKNEIELKSTFSEVILFLK